MRIKLLHVHHLILTEILAMSRAEPGPWCETRAGLTLLVIH